MHLDFEKTDFSYFATDICIIGAGVAGITMAHRLIMDGRTVTILESGGFDFDAATADLNVGETVGQRYYELDHARLRFFGGTSAIWGGRVAELDPIDFEKRDWVPHSGWPITYDEIKPYYDEARVLFGLPVRRSRLEDLSDAGIRLPAFNSDELSLKLWSFDRQSNRFAFKSCDNLARHPRCTVLTHATVTSIETDEHGRSVTSVEVRGLSGRRARVHARAFVLAAGGIENPRLLLASRSGRGTGLGNDHDLVGRFFMEHPHARGGKILTDRAWDLLKTFRRHDVKGQSIAALIASGERMQARERTLNTSLTIAARQPADHAQSLGMRAYNRVKHGLKPTHGARSLWLFTKRAAALAQKIVDPARPWLLHKLGRTELALVVRAEQAPNPDSRVMLSAERDALGMPRVKLDWRMTDLDIHSVDRLVAALGGELERLKVGRVMPAPWLSDSDRCWHFDPLVSAHPIGGYHHMGTTRMAADPKHGVVDEHCRLHGTENLYIAGSSVFPTSGWANPTFTIAALALRTADHLSRHMKKSLVLSVACDHTSVSAARPRNDGLASSDPLAAHSRAQPWRNWCRHPLETCTRLPFDFQRRHQSRGNP